MFNVENQYSSMIFVEASMAKLTLTKASKKVGKERTTLFKAIKSGNLSASKNNKGQWEIEESELSRVYPDAFLEKKTKGNSMEGQSTINIENQYPSMSESMEFNALSMRIEMIERENKLLREQLEKSEDREKELLATLKAQTQALPKPEEKKVAQEEPPKRKKFLGLF